MDKRILAGVLAVVIIGGLAAGVILLLPPPGPGAEPLKIGVVTPITGSAAPGGGLYLRDAIQFAAEEYGEVLGRPIQLVIGDIYDGPAGVTETERLITTEGCKVIVGSWGAGGITASERADFYGVPFFDLTAGADWLSERNFTRFYRQVPLATTWAREFADVIAEYWAPTLGKAVEDLNVAVVYDDWSTPWLDPFHDELAALNITPVHSEMHFWNIADFTPLIITLKGLDIDILVAEHVTPSALLFRQQMLALNLDPDVFFTMGVGYSTDEFIENIGEAGVEGVTTCTWPSYAMNWTVARDFKTRFNARFGYNGMMAAYGGMMFLLDAIEEAGVYDETAIADALAAKTATLGEYPCYWPIEFNEDGDNIHTQAESGFHAVAQWQSGELVIVWPEDDAWATGELIPTW